MEVFQGNKRVVYNEPIHTVLGSNKNIRYDIAIKKRPPPGFIPPNYSYCSAEIHFHDPMFGSVNGKLRYLKNFFYPPHDNLKCEVAIDNDSHSGTSYVSLIIK